MSINPRMEKFIASERKGSLIIAVISSAIGIHTFFNLVTEGNLWVAIALSCILAYVGMVIGNAGLLFVLQWKHYNFDLAEFIRDADEASDHYEARANGIPEVSTMTVAGMPENRMGEFQGADIFEWIDFQLADGTIQRYKYHSCVDGKVQKKLLLQPGQLLIQPGIIYQVDAPINIGA